MKFNKLIPEFDVLSINETIKFYTSIGFKIEYERPNEKFVFMSFGDDVQFMFQELDKGNHKWQTGTLERPFGRGINFSIEVDNVDKIYKTLKKNGYSIMVDIEENWYEKDGVLLGNKEFLVKDPDGYLLRFNEDLGEKKI